MNCAGSPSKAASSVWTPDHHVPSTLAARRVGLRLKQIGIFAATRWECSVVCRALHRHERLSAPRATVGHRGSIRVIVAQTGIGSNKARTVCRGVLGRYPLDGVISSGFAGALVPAQIGDVLIGTEVVLADLHGDAVRIEARWPCDAGLVSRARAAAESAGLSSHAGPVLTWRHVLCRASEKRRIAAQSSAIGLDMESAAIGAVAGEHRIPFAVIRGVSDLVDEDLPIDFNLFLHRRDWPRAAMFLARPSVMLGLLRLRRQTALAGSRITVFFERFFDRAAEGRPHDRGDNVDQRNG